MILNLYVVKIIVNNIYVMKLYDDDDDDGYDNN